MKAIILAAGMGTRLKHLTKDIPKCMININGKTILQRQIETFRKCGINEIIVVRGYKKELINYLGIKCYDNLNFENNNNLVSLFHAEKEMNDDFIMTFCDIIFDEKVLKKLLENKGDVCKVIDKDWKKAYENRTLHPVPLADKVIIENNKIIKIGKGVDLNKTHGEWIGLSKFSKKGAEILKKHYHRTKKLFWNKPFHEAPTFEKGHIMDITQELIDNNHSVSPVIIQGGWAEIDTPEDYENIKNKTMEVN